MASNNFILRQAPRFQTGYGVALAFIGVELVAAVIFVFGLKRENRLRDEGKRDYRWQLAQKEIENLGDDRPDFRFSY